MNFCTPARQNSPPIRTAAHLRMSACDRRRQLRRKIAVANDVSPQLHVKQRQLREPQLLVLHGRRELGRAGNVALDCLARGLLDFQAPNSAPVKLCHCGELFAVAALRRPVVQRT